MKRLILISASLILASVSFAQTVADNSLYKFDKQGTPKEVRKLGRAPEFPFLRNLKSSEQVYAAIKRHEDDNTPQMNKLNGLLMQIGYTNGAKDLQASDITEAYMKPGTEGNMGSKGYTYAYYRLEGDPSEFKAWKITPNNSNATGPLYLFAKCGNPFYPKNAATTACINVPVEVKPDESRIDLQSSGSEVSTDNKVFVYYARKHHEKDETPHPVLGIADEYPSTPVMINETKDVDVRPETYMLTASSQERTVTACTDSTLNLTANINMEKTSTYTGNYPSGDHKVYEKVSKRHYNMMARKMHHAQRKADKIARRTCVRVDAKYTRT